MKKRKKAFTLVELILVIVIISILSTIGYVSFIGYYGSARDSVRVSDITTIYNGLSIIKIQNGKYVMPDNYIELKAGNILLTYQGEVSSRISTMIKSHREINDPKDERKYIYTIDKNQNKAQLMGYLEQGQQVKVMTYDYINKAYAQDGEIYKNRYVYIYGDKIGIITDTNKIALQYNTTQSGINILSSQDTQSGINTYFGGGVYDNGKSTSTGSVLAVQMDQSLNGNLPCSTQEYNGYVITSINHNETANFVKLLNITNGTQTKQLTIQCINGELDTGNSVETIISTSCTTAGYVPYNNNCVINNCKNSIPDNATSNSTNTDLNKQYYLIPWTYNTTSGDCTYVCNPNFTYNSSTQQCDANTRIQNCIGKVLNSSYNNTLDIIQTWSGSTSSWRPSELSVYDTNASSNECRYKCDIGYSWDSVNKVCIGNSCTTPSNGVYNGLTYVLASQSLLHGNTVMITSANRSFGTSPTDGVTKANFTFSCNLGVLTLTSTTSNLGSCNTGGYSFNGNYSTPGCSDVTTPTITSVSALSPSCGTIRFTINGASDGVGLNATPYSFDGGSTWQTLNYKDFSSTNYTVNANLIKVRDTSGNTYTYASSINGTSAVCTCNLPWGGTINNGQSITAYGASSVACGSSCSSETRTCTNGVLSGTYSYGSCSVAACYTYSWYSGSRGTCTTSNSVGSKTRTVYCKRNDGLQVSDSYCTGTKPSTTLYMCCAGGYDHRGCHFDVTETSGGGSNVFTNTITGYQGNLNATCSVNGVWISRQGTCRPSSAATTPTCSAGSGANGSCSFSRPTTNNNTYIKFRNSNYTISSGTIEAQCINGIWTNITFPDGCVAATVY